MRNILPCLLGPNLKTLNLSTISAAFDKKVTSEVYNIMDSVCNNLESLTLGQSFIFTPEIISNMNTKLEKFNKESKLFLKIFIFGFLEGGGLCIFFTIRHTVHPLLTIKKFQKTFKKSFQENLVGTLFKCIQWSTFIINTMNTTFYSIFHS